MTNAPGWVWSVKPFQALTASELYALLQLRSAVFVVEQACAFQDIDGADFEALHLQAALDGQIVAYARCFAPGVQHAEASIGRVLTHPTQRGAGLGHVLLARAIACIEQRWGRQPIRIGAQAQLEAFYQQHGFADAGRRYVEDGISHLKMIRPAGTQDLSQDAFT